jgi:hypothetical protein
MEILARWREAGRWWEQEPETEWVRFLDERGIMREVCLDVSEPATAKAKTKRTRDERLGHTVDYDVIRLEYRQALRNVEKWAQMKVESHPVAASMEFLRFLMGEAP